MSTYPKSPREMTSGMMYFPRMLDKIRLHARGGLPEDYHKNLGAVKAADGACCNFLRVHTAICASGCYKAERMTKFWNGASKKAAV